MSRYRDQLGVGFQFIEIIRIVRRIRRAKMHQLLDRDAERRGPSINNGWQGDREEGVSNFEDYVTHQKRCPDMVYFAQDAYDPVDVSVPMESQKETFLLVSQTDRETSIRFEQRACSERSYTKTQPGFDEKPQTSAPSRQ